MTRASQNLTCPVDNWDAWFVHLVIYKLDQTTRDEWGKSLGQSAEFPTFAQLTTFIETTTEASQTVQASVTHLKKAPTSSGNKDSPSQTTRAHVAARDSNTKKNVNNGCIVCSELHTVTSCNRYKAMNPSERCTLLSTKNLCENCLWTNHVSPLIVEQQVDVSCVMESTIPLFMSTEKTRQSLRQRTTPSMSKTNPPTAWKLTRPLFITGVSSYSHCSIREWAWWLSNSKSTPGSRCGVLIRDWENCPVFVVTKDKDRNIPVLGVGGTSAGVGRSPSITEVSP